MILIDTSAILAVAEGRGILDELREQYPHHELGIVEGTLAELSSLEQARHGKKAAEARLALRLINEQDLNIVSESADHVDAALTAAASRLDAMIITLDGGLIARAKTLRIPVLSADRDGRITRP